MEKRQQNIEKISSRIQMQMFYYPTIESAVEVGNEVNGFEMTSATKQVDAARVAAVRGSKNWSPNRKQSCMAVVIKCNFCGLLNYFES